MTVFTNVAATVLCYDLVAKNDGGKVKVVEQGKLEKAIKVLEEYKTLEALRYIYRGNLVHGEGIEHPKVDEKKLAEKYYKNKKSWRKFIFRDTIYETYLEDLLWEDPKKMSALPNDHYHLLANDSLVLQSKCERYDADYGGEDTDKFSPIGDDASLISKDAIKVLRLGEWVKELPVMVDLAKAGYKKWMAELEAEHAEREAKQVEDNIDLGDFE